MTLTGNNTTTAGCYLDVGTTDFGSPGATTMSSPLWFSSVSPYPAVTFDNTSGGPMTTTSGHGVSTKGNLIFTGTNDMTFPMPAGVGQLGFGNADLQPTITVNNATLTFGGNIGTLIGGTMNFNKSGPGRLVFGGRRQH